MKVWIFNLAILIILIAFIPYLFSMYMSEKQDLSDIKIELYSPENNKLQTISLEDYIVGVVCAEMPAEFESEALKSQAVAARTYAVKKLNSDKNDHEKGDLCTDFKHCQAYATKEICKDKWGKDYKEYINKIEQAVQSTSGEYVSYNGDVAMTVFHSCSNGVTEKASDVWSGEVPYLVNVSSEGDYIYKDYISTVSFYYDDFLKLLEKFLKQKINSALAPIGNISYSTGGNILNIELFGIVFEGSDIRNIFSLKSTSFELEYVDNKFVFTVYGNGHGVGMSQYGANYMAQNKSSYKDIISHYYPGTEILKMNNLD